MSTEKKYSGRVRFAAVLLCLLLSTGGRAEEACRTFTSSEGRTLDAQLIDYEAASESVILKTDGGKTGRMALAKFSEADQNYILNWGAEHCFLEKLELRLSLDSASVSKEESGISDPGKKVFDVFYELCFINGSDAPFEKLEYEYCIFYNQGIRDDRTVNYEEGSCYGTGVVEGLAPDSEQVSKTKPIRLYTEGGRVGLFGTDVISLGNVRGIWLRFRTKLPSGREIEREYRTSDDELWKWAPYTFGAGMNEGDKKQTYYYVK